MIKKISFLALLLIGLTLGSCTGKKANPEGITYSDMTLESFLTTWPSKDYVLIDVRTPGEIAEGKISEDALEIDYKESNFTEKITQLDKSKKYIVYCRSGGRSASASQIMIDNGFTQVSNLLGGYDQYSAK